MTRRRRRSVSDVMQSPSHVSLDTVIVIHHTHMQQEGAATLVIKRKGNSGTGQHIVGNVIVCVMCRIAEANRELIGPGRGCVLALSSASRGEESGFESVMARGERPMPATTGAGLLTSDDEVEQDGNEEGGADERRSNEIVYKKGQSERSVDECQLPSSPEEEVSSTSSLFPFQTHQNYPHTSS